MTTPPTRGERELTPTARLSRGSCVTGLRGRGKYCSRQSHESRYRVLIRPPLRLWQGGRSAPSRRRRVPLTLSGRGRYNVDGQSGPLARGRRGSAGSSAEKCTGFEPSTRARPARAVSVSLRWKFCSTRREAGAVSGFLPDAVTLAGVPRRVHGASPYTQASPTPRTTDTRRSVSLSARMAQNGAAGPRVVWLVSSVVSQREGRAIS